MKTPESTPTDSELIAFEHGELSADDFERVANWMESDPTAEDRLRRLTVGDSDWAIRALRTSRPAAGDLASDDVVRRVISRLTESGGTRVSRADEDELPVPDTIGEYEILDRIGRGGMGVVYHAEHRRLKRCAAIKLLRPSLASDQRFRSHFEREMAVLGQLDHPNLLQAYDAGFDEGRLFLATEYIEGRPLDAVIRDEGPLPAPDACEVIRQAALGLASAHEKGHVHRDIKPSNLILGANGVVKVIDLGLARTLQSVDAEQISGPQSSEFLGTPDYIAPEQVDDALVADSRSDCYALGCTLYTLLAGRPPFGDLEHRNSASILSAQQTLTPTPLDSRRSDLPSELCQVVARMLAKDPDVRPQSLSEVAGQLKPFCVEQNIHQLADPDRVPLSVAETHGPGRNDTETVAKLAIHTAKPSASPQRSRRTVALISALAGLLVFGAGAWLTIRWKTPDGKTVDIKVTQPAAAVGIESERAAITTKSGETIELSPGRSPADLDVNVNGNVRPEADATDEDRFPFSPEKARSRQEETAREFGVAVAMTNSIGMEFTLIPSGEFVMGSSAKEAADAARGSWWSKTILTEWPQHSVEISRPFYIGRCEVTVAEFRQFVESTGHVTNAEKSGGIVASRRRSMSAQWRTPGHTSTDRHPVVLVSWFDASAFCEWLSKQEGVAYSLPTEAQWEWACRAGSAGRYCFGDDLRQLPDYANIWNTKGIPQIAEAPNVAAKRNVSPVGQRKPNAFGLYDVHGNVFEWCSDWFGMDYYQTSPRKDPSGLSRGETRVVRSGFEAPRLTRSAFRYRRPPDQAEDVVGFRVCIAVPAAE